MAVEDLYSEANRLTYSNNVQMVAQQMGNPFRAGVTELRCTGEAHRAAALVGQTEPIVAESRGRRNIENPIGMTSRWLIRPDEIVTGQYLDEEDKFDMAMDPTSVLFKGHMVSIQRVVGDRILGIKKDGANYQVAYGGILGKASSGKRAEVQTDLPPANILAASTSGLSLEKLIQVREDLGKADFGIDGDELYCAITPSQVTDLLNIAALTSTNLNAFTLEQLKTGQPTTLMGMTWVVTNRLPVNQAGDRMCPVWSKRNIMLGVWKDITGDMWPDPHARNKPYMEVAARVDCVRAEDAGVRVILCQE